MKTIKLNRKSLWQPASKPSTYIELLANNFVVGDKISLHYKEQDPKSKTVWVSVYKNGKEFNKIFLEKNKKTKSKLLSFGTIRDKFEIWRQLNIIRISDENLLDNKTKWINRTDSPDVYFEVISVNVQKSVSDFIENYNDEQVVNSIIATFLFIKFCQLKENEANALFRNAGLTEGVEDIKEYFESRGSNPKQFGRLLIYSDLGLSDEVTNNFLSEVNFELEPFDKKKKKYEAFATGIKETPERLLQSVGMENFVLFFDDFFSSEINDILKNKPGDKKINKPEPRARAGRLLHTTGNSMWALDKIRNSKRVTPEIAVKASLILDGIDNDDTDIPIDEEKKLSDLFENSTHSRKFYSENSEKIKILRDRVLSKTHDNIKNSILNYLNDVLLFDAKEEIIDVDIMVKHDDTNYSLIEVKSYNKNSAIYQGIGQLLHYKQMLTKRFNESKVKNLVLVVLGEPPKQFISTCDELKIGLWKFDYDNTQGILEFLK